MDQAHRFGLRRELVQRGWFHLPLDMKRVEPFADFVDAIVQSDRVCSIDDLYGQMAVLTTGNLDQFDMRSPSHYGLVISRVLSLSDASLPKPISVKHASQMLDLSMRTIQRAFNVTFGVGAGQFLRNRRLQLAHSLLKMPDATVHSSAYAAGFRHVPRFAQQYRRLYGHRPSDVLRVS